MYNTLHIMFYVMCTAYNTWQNVFPSLWLNVMRESVCVHVCVRVFVCVCARPPGFPCVSYEEEDTCVS